jgi:hypothetical protein
VSLPSSVSLPRLSLPRLSRSLLPRFVGAEIECFVRVFAFALCVTAELCVTVEVVSLPRLSRSLLPRFVGTEIAGVESAGYR